MEISLKGKRAIVGGSSRGLGNAIATQLAASGATITLMARNEEKLASALSKLPVPFGQQHQYLEVDFADFATFQQIVLSYFAHNTVNILINNTNGPAAGTVLEKSVDDYQHAFDLLFKTVCFTTMEALKGMRSNGYGRIINLSSISVKEPLQNLVLSNSIRSAVIGWSKTLARELAPEGITVNNILTGYFDTERLDEININQAKSKGQSMEDYKNGMKATVPMGRFGKPEEFGYLVNFLASEQAGYISGTNIPIDGCMLRSI